MQAISLCAFHVVVGQAYEDLRVQLDQERASYLEHSEQQRQSFAVEKTAISRRYQVQQTGRGCAGKAGGVPYFVAGEFSSYMFAVWGRMEPMHLGLAT